MNFAPLVRVAAICSVLFISPVLFAQQAAKASAPVEILDVKFTAAPVLGVREPMNRMEVNLRALHNAKLLKDKNAVVPNPKWVDKIKVTVTTAYKAPAYKKAQKAGAAAGDLEPFIYYRSSATILTMEENGSGSVYFYLPGEIIKRDQLQKEPFMWMVSVEADGEEVAPTLKMFSKNIRTEHDMKTFKEEADRGVSETTGIFRAQYQVFDMKVPSNSLTLVREDTTRP